MTRKAAKINYSTSMPYTLTFWGGLSGVRYARVHSSFDEARDEALRVLNTIDNRAAHPAIIDGPDIHMDGITIP